MPNHPLGSAHGDHPLRSSAGAGLGIGACLAVGTWIVVNMGFPLALVAPIGASAVLVFAVPASPLAQPRAVFGGNLISAFVGLVLSRSGLPPVALAALATALAIMAMHILRCLHPPGGALALLAATGAQGALWPWSFLLIPVAINSLTLLAVGWVFNNATGSRYPHRNELLPEHRLPITINYDRAALDAVLDELEDRPDVDADDLDAIIRAVLIRQKANLRRKGAHSPDLAEYDA